MEREREGGGVKEYREIVWEEIKIVNNNNITSVFLISSYGALLAQTASYGIAHFSPWASGTVNHDYIVTNSINSLLIGSRCIPNGAHTNHCWANLAPCISKTLYIIYKLHVAFIKTIEAVC